MTDFHLPDEFFEPVAKAVFGGPMPPVGIINRAIRDNALKWPVIVAAVREWHPSATSGLSEVRLLQLHPGLTYLLTNLDPGPFTRMLRSRRLAYAAVETATGSQHLFHAIQRSIIALRERDLAALQAQPMVAGSSCARKGPPGEPTWQAELDTQHMLVDHVLRHEPQWPGTAALWVRMVMVRHPMHLNEVRRKLTQLLASLCQGIDRNPQLGYVFSSMMEQLYKTHLFSDLPAFLVHAIQQLRLHLPGNGASTQPHPQAVDLALAYIRAHAHEPISLRHVAGAASVTPSHLARLFRTSVGQTVTQFLQRQRVVLAMRKLTQTDQGVLAIALDCGFGSVEHFHRVFKRQAGQSPRQYRLNHPG